ncbi:MAG: metal-dependent hydrolase [Opitutaceae bacterium]|nr:metal-dependent hydrolase [Opitutaceae bacterium]
MKITYLAHSCFLVETAKARLIIDPFLTGNPLAPVQAVDVQVDYILCSHGHEDHTGDALAIAKRCGAPIIANYEITEYFAAQGAQTHGMNPGGAFDFPFGRVKLTLAHHSSSVNAGLNPVYLGNPCGIILQADGKTLYHAGDTALFLDMQLIGQLGLDLAMVPIGDNFTMGIDDAVAALDLLKPKVAVPMHYNTWPVIAVDADKFVEAAARSDHTVRVLKPGESLTV